MRHPKAAHRYELLPSLVLGFHGTDADTVEKVLAGKEHLKPSRNDYDWLGHGIYFWEYSPQRAMEFATLAASNSKFSRGKIKAPAVIGAVIDPGVCLNLLEASALAQLKYAYEVLALIDKPPKNKGKDLAARFLDCAVIEVAHQLREPLPGQVQALHRYDSVRGAFWEGKPLYPGAGFSEKNHVQLCVRNTDCIKGYFRVID